MGIPSKHLRHFIPSLSKQKKVNRFAPYRSGWEAEYAERLKILRRAGVVLRWWYEPERLELSDRCTYLPDFFVDYADGTSVFEEIKGFSRTSGIVKFKVASEMYPKCLFRMVTKRKGSWVTIREMKAGKNVMQKKGKRSCAKAG